MGNQGTNYRRKSGDKSRREIRGKNQKGKSRKKEYWKIRRKSMEEVLGQIRGQNTAGIPADKTHPEENPGKIRALMELQKLCGDEV